VSDRKYRQRGYQDRSDDKTEKREGVRPKPKDMTFGPRFIQMPGTRTVSRCANCGELLQSLSEPLGQCPKCKADLHACKQCTYFDPGSRFECTQPVPDRVADKILANNCQFFSLRQKVEKETSVATGNVNDARAAFERLFKK
jgi:hypothetical protein